MNGDAGGVEIARSRRPHSTAAGDEDGVAVAAIGRERSVQRQRASVDPDGPAAAAAQLCVCAPAGRAEVDLDSVEQPVARAALPEVLIAERVAIAARAAKAAAAGILSSLSAAAPVAVRAESRAVAAGVRRDRRAGLGFSR